jgi:hypothetical protein
MLIYHLEADPEVVLVTNYLSTPFCYSLSKSDSLKRNEICFTRNKNADSQNII